MIAFIAFISFVLGLLWKGKLFFIIAASVVWLIFVWRRFAKKRLIFALAVLSFGILYTNVSIPYNNSQKTFNGVVVDSKTNYYIFESKMTKYYVYEKNCTRETGDILTINGTSSEYKFAVIESQLDFNKYLSDRGVDHEIYATSVKCHFAFPIRRHEIINRFLNKYTGTTKVLIGSLLFGQNDYGSNLQSSMETLQISRVLSLSGIHINMVLSILSYLLGLVMRERWARGLSFMIMAPYLFFVFERISIIRVTLLYMMSWCNDFVMKKKVGYSTQISLLGIMCLIISRYLVNELGFILTFAMPLVLFFSREAFSRFNRQNKELFIHILIYLFFVPTQIYFNNEINLLSFLLQSVLSPLLVFVFVLSLISFYTVPMPHVLSFIISMIDNPIELLGRLDLSFITGQLSVAIIVIFYVSFIYLIISIERKWKRHVRAMTIIILSSILVSSIPIANLLTCSVSFINVGQGDSILIRDGFKTVMIDTGGSLYSDIASESLIPYLKKNQIYRIDYLITTHDDLDHSGAAQSLIDKFPVKNYVTEKSAFPLRVGNLLFTNLNTFSSEASDDNAQSLVIYLEFLGLKWLFTGDAPIEIEKNIVEEYPRLDVDILKVGHHGSDSSTCGPFLEAITPAEAVISVGKNSYGHPTDLVLDRLRKYKVKVRRTDIEGTISYTKWRI